MTSEYGLSDPRYNNSYNEVISTFCVRTFKSIMPLIMTVLEKMKTEYEIEKGVCLSNGSQTLTSGPTDLFKFISQILDMTKYCSHSDVINSMLSLAYKSALC